MSEIYRDAVDAEVSFDVPGAVVTAVEFTRDGATYGAIATASPALVPYAITHSDGPFRVKWTFSIDSTMYTREEEHDVVTPLFLAGELTAFNASFGTLSANKVVELEALCRKIIESATGQRFGYSKKKVKAYGGGDSVLNVKEHVISVGTVDGLAVPYRPVNGGFAIEREGFVWSGDIVGSLGPIRDPRLNTTNRKFANNTAYTIDGEFGWLSVPNDIKQAALLLAEEFSCKEASWRDRYIKAISASDWRFEFDGRAFEGTGSVAVDKLISKYVVSRAAII